MQLVPSGRENLYFLCPTDILTVIGMSTCPEGIINVMSISSPYLFTSLMISFGHLSGGEDVVVGAGVVVDVVVLAVVDVVVVDWVVVVGGPTRINFNSIHGDN